MSRPGGGVNRRTTSDFLYMNSPLPVQQSISKEGTCGRNHTEQECLGVPNKYHKPHMSANVVLK